MIHYLIKKTGVCQHHQLTSKESITLQQNLPREAREKNQITLYMTPGSPLQEILKKTRGGGQVS